MEHVLMQAQRDLEEFMVNDGRDRFLARMSKAVERGTEASTPYGIRMLKSFVEPVADVIEAAVTEATMGRAGAHHKAVAYLDGIESDVAAYLTLKGVLDGVSRVRTKQQVATEVANLIQDELWMRRYKAAHPKEFARTMETVKESTSMRYTRRVGRLMAARKGVTLTWAIEDMQHLGNFLIHIVEGLGLFTEEVFQESGTKKVKKLVPTETALEWISKCRTEMEILSPTYLPTIVPPKPWTGPRDGGYWTGLARRVKFLKGRSSVLKGRDLTQVYAAVNAIQDTAWAVNREVLRVLHEAIDSGRKVEGIPMLSNIEVEKELGAAPEDAEARKVWRKKASSIHKGNAQAASKRMQLYRTLNIADRMSQYEEIYFPHSLDFRGRAYAVPTFLNPQGTDYVKALLTFADAAPILDAEAAGYLAIHGANCYGYDKAALEDRVAWVEANEAMILTVARDPMGDGFRLWNSTDVSSPWCFLAFCLEWAGFKREGFGFLSSLPVAMDGSCNGIQHYSAALRDEVGGRAVNLVPADKPSDIYGEVARRTVEYLSALLRPEGAPSGTFLAEQVKKWSEEKVDKKTGEVARKAIDWKTYAKQWLAFGIDRKIAKRSVMTLPYGSTQRSSRDFIEEAMKKRVIETGKNPFATEDRDGIFGAALFLNPLLWQAITDTVTSAREGMAWLKSCAKVCLEADKDIAWTTADGFPVVQRYLKTQEKQVRTALGGGITTTSKIQVETDKLDRLENTNGIAPNWVHSQDATAMRMATLEARALGITSFAMIHDSFGTHAANSGAFGRAIRSSFVRLYKETDPMGDFIRDLRVHVGAPSLPDAPPKGNLDIDLVLASDFFFA